jgi:hypothetical protein
VLTLLLAAILVGGIGVTIVGAAGLAGGGGATTTSSLVEPPPTRPPDPGAVLGPTGSPPPSAPASATPAATPGPTPTIGPSTPTPQPTPPPLPPSPSAQPVAGYPSIEDAVAAALDRMAVDERFGGACDVAPANTVCGGRRTQVAGLDAWAIGYSGSDFLLGTVVVRGDAGGWHPVLFDPGTVLEAGPAVVGGSGECVPLRAEPGRAATRLACLPDGARVGLTGVMTVADGYLWAAADGGGWLPSRWLCGADCEGVPDTVWSFEPAP